MKHRKVELLIDKYLEGTATAAEMKIVDAWYDSFDKAPGLSAAFSQKEIEAFLKSAYSRLENKLD